MSDRRYSLILTDETVRNRAAWLLSQAPLGYTIELKPTTRSAEQNAKLWPMLADVRKAKPEGREHSDEAWKALFMHSLGQEMQLERALDGKGVVPIGYRSSLLGKRLFADLIEIIYEYGARFGVRWSEPNPVEMDRSA
jgi:hypothetical protein